MNNKDVNENINDDIDERIDEEKFENSTDDFDFDEEFLDHVDPDKKIKHGRKKWNAHMIFFLVVGCLFLFAIIRLLIWNRGKDSDYDPNAVTTEFDTEPLDYIQPLNSTQLKGKPDDGVLTVFCLGNSPFADDGENNLLAKAFGNATNATVVNASFADSFESLKNATYDESYPADGISLYYVTLALTAKDTSIVKKAAAAISDEAAKKADALSSMDLSTADAVVIMYDLSDYIDNRPVMDPNDEDNLLTVNGCLNASIQMIQNTYPYIRIIVLSTPASGKTIDDFYVDGNVQDLGNGTLVDYLGNAANVCMSNGVTFIDTYFGAINVENRTDLLKNDYHLNEAGCKAIVERFAKLVTLE